MHILTTEEYAQLVKEIMGINKDKANDSED